MRKPTKKYARFDWATYTLFLVDDRDECIRKIDQMLSVPETLSGNQHFRRPFRVRTPWDTHPSEPMVIRSPTELKVFRDLLVILLT